MTATEPLNSNLLGRIQRHYNELSSWYALCWGEHIHHGYFLGNSGRQQAQIELIRQLVNYAEITPGSAVLDVGSGLGGSAFWLAENLNCKVTGINFSATQLQIANMTKQQRGLNDQVEFLLHDANDLRSLKWPRLDALWIVECNEHLFNKRKFFAAAKGLLRPGATVAVATWLRGGQHSAWNADQCRLYEQLCNGMLVPGLETISFYQKTLTDLGYRHVTAWDVSDKVAPTWRHVSTVLSELSPLIGTIKNSDVLAFLQAAAQMPAAFESGVMRYGFLRATC